MKSLTEMLNSIMEQNKQCFKISFGGVVVALCSLGFLASNIIPSFSLIIPMYLGFLIGIVTYEIGGRWGLLTFSAALLLSMFVSPDLSPLIVFAMFFGYYPIIYVKMAGHKKNLFQSICKIAIFNIAFWLWFKLMTSLIPSFDLMMKSDFFKENATIGLIIASNIFFFSYSVLLENAYDYYTHIFRKTYLRKG